MANRILTTAQALRTNVADASTSAGARVYLGRLRPMTEDRRPLPDPTAARTWVNVVQLDVNTPGDGGQTMTSHIDWLVDFGVDLYVRAREDDWYAAAMGLWAQVHAALMTDYTQGLAYVVDTVPVGALDPETDFGDLVSVSLRTNWRLHVRTSVASMES